MKAMKIGDQSFFYHSNEGKEIVGIVEVVKEYYPDHTDPKERFGMVDFKAIKPVPKPVTLKTIKETKALEGIFLVMQMRLSVCPITKKEWDIICKMGDVK